MVRGFDEGEKVIIIPRRGRPKTKEDNQPPVIQRRILTETPTCRLGGTHKVRSYIGNGHR